MGVPNTEFIQCDRPGKPSIPRYLMKTKFGQDYNDEVGYGPDSGPQPVSIPKRRHGVTELKSWPMLAYSKSKSKSPSSQGIGEEFPWKLVSSPLVDTRGATLVPLTHNQAENKSNSHVRRCVISNRHIPRDASVYYVEMEGKSLDVSSIGLVKLAVKHIRQGPASKANGDWQSNHTTDGNGVSHNVGNGVGNGIGIETFATLNGPNSNLNGSPFAPRFRNTRSAFNDSIRSGNDTDIGDADDDYNDIEEEEMYDDDEDIDDDDDEDLNDLDDDDDEENGDNNDDDDVEDDDDDDDEDDDDDDDDDDEDEGSYGGRILDSRTYIKFPPITALYDFRCGRTTDDLILAPEKGHSIRPFCTWDLEVGNMFLEKTVFPSSYTQVHLASSNGMLTSQRIGMLVDFANRKIHFTINGRLVDQSLTLPEDFETETSGTKSELFPFFAFPSGKITVHFGDGMLPNDGFMFDIMGYMNKQSGLSLLNIPPNKQVALNGNIQPTSELVQEYFEFYGYADVLGPDASESVRHRQKIRQCIERGDISGVKELTNSVSLHYEVRYALEFAEYVEAACALMRECPHTKGSSTLALDEQSSTFRKRSLAEVLEMGKQLLQQTRGDYRKQEQIREASGILVTREPRSSEFSKYYDENAKKNLMDLLFRALQSDSQHVPALKTLSDHAYQVSRKRPVNSRRVAQAVAVLRDTCDGELWRW